RIHRSKVQEYATDANPSRAANSSRSSKRSGPQARRTKVTRGGPNGTAAGTEIGVSPEILIRPAFLSKVRRDRTAVTRHLPLTDSNFRFALFSAALRHEG